MIIFKLIEIDLDKERERVHTVKYTTRQRKALIRLYDLFEKGEWQKCLDLVNDKKVFPYNKRKEYPETEHIGVEVGNILRNLGYDNFYTQQHLKDELKTTMEQT